MRHFGITLLASGVLLAAGAEAQQVYRWVDENGVVHYSDQPPDDDQVATEAVDLNVPPGIGNPSRRVIEPIAQSPSPSPDDNDLLAAQQAAAADSQETVVPYTDLEILSPEAGEVLWNIATRLSVAATLTPTLQGQHQVQWILDGQPVGEPTQSLNQTLAPVYRGTHSIAANVLDAQGRTLYRSNAVTFYVQQTTVNRAP